MSADLLDHPLISDRYFFPRPGALADPFWVDAGGVRLACHFHRVNPAARTLVHFHGNGEIVDDYLGDFVDLVGRMGCNCFLEVRFDNPGDIFMALTRVLASPTATPSSPPAHAQPNVPADILGI